MYHGFSLLELLIVLVIIAILSCLAETSYAAHVGRVQRQQAEMVLTQLCVRLEAYASEHDNSYANASLKKLGLSSLIAGLHYTIHLSQVTSSQFTLEAVPTAAQADADPHCGSLTINEINQKGVLTVGHVGSCWG